MPAHPRSRSQYITSRQNDAPSAYQDAHSGTYALVLLNHARRPTKRSRSSQPGASAARPAAKAPQVNGAFHPTNDAILVPKTSFETRSTVRSLRESMWTGALVRHSSIPVLFGRSGSTYPAGGRGSVGNDSTVVVGGGGWPPASASSSRVGRVFPG